MDTTKDYHTKSERQIPCVITYMWNLKHDPNGNRLMDIENRLVNDITWYLSFFMTSLCMINSSCIHVAANDIISFFMAE